MTSSENAGANFERWSGYAGAVVDIAIGDTHVTIDAQGAVTSEPSVPGIDGPVYIITAHNPGDALDDATNRQHKANWKKSFGPSVCRCSRLLVVGLTGRHRASRRPA